MGDGARDALRPARRVVDPEDGSCTSPLDEPVEKCPPVAVGLRTTLWITFQPPSNAFPSSISAGRMQAPS